MRRLFFIICSVGRSTMDLQLAHDIINICSAMAPEGATVEDCAEKLGIAVPDWLTYLRHLMNW